MYSQFKVDSWETARKIGTSIVKGTNWVFRGQTDMNWGLSTNMERRAKIYACSPDYFKDRENFILFQFQRHAFQYFSSPPDKGELLDWLALLQHHGGPTRLLDFTYSFYVAAFFALENSNSDSAIWAINIEKIEEMMDEITNSEYDTDELDDPKVKNLVIATDVLKGNQQYKMVINVEPKQLHERLVTQQGLFLFPCDISCSFLENLKNTFSPDDLPSNSIERSMSIGDSIEWDQIFESPVIKIIIPRQSYKAGLSDLKDMNITSSTLFPGLDGYARSLFYYLRAFESDIEIGSI